MSKIWSSKIQGIQTLNQSRLIRFTDKTFESMIHIMNIKGEERVLELGCSPGTFTRRLADFFLEMSITGLDFDENFISYCKDQAKEHNYLNLEYTQGDALNTHFNDNTFDLTSSHTVIEHVPNDLFLKEQYRILKPGGKVVVFNTKGGHALHSEKRLEISVRENELMTKIGSTLNQLQNDQKVALYDANPQEILKTMEAVGFKHLTLDLVPYTICIDDARHDIYYKEQILKSERDSQKEFIEMALIENPSTLTSQELIELNQLIDNRYEQRMDMIRNNQNIWDFSISQTVVMTGIK